MNIDNRPPFVQLEGCDIKQLFGSLPSPAYVIDKRRLKYNGEILKKLADETGCKVLLAQKAFSNYDMYALLSQYLAGTEASGLYEARLGSEAWPCGEVHVYSAAYRSNEFDEILEYADHIVFNSPAQLEKFGLKAKRAGKSIGIRINPEFSTQEGHEIYDPCGLGSRLGTTRKQWDEQMSDTLISLLDGLHFHTLCEQDSDALEATLGAVERNFGDILPIMKWLNFGGGHHITRPDYDIARLKCCIISAQEKWDVEVYLEPGEACALNAGYLVTRVLDIVKNGDITTAILDMSAACHTPDVLEMPYLPPLYGAGKADEKHFNYRFGGPTCLAGDVFGEYSFDSELTEGDMLVFGDMAIYTMCKNNTFNGMPLPSIWTIEENGELKKLASFGYEDFKLRLGAYKVSAE